MGTQVKLRAILLSNEHLQQFIHSSLRKIVLSCKLKQINLLLRPGYTVSLTLQTSSVLVLSRFNPRILVPVGHRWRQNHDGQECLQLIGPAKIRRVLDDSDMCLEKATVCNNMQLYAIMRYCT